MTFSGLTSAVKLYTKHSLHKTTSHNKSQEGLWFYPCGVDSYTIRFGEIIREWLTINSIIIFYKMATESNNIKYTIKAL